MGVAPSALWSRETLSHAISGAIASAVSVSVFYPLETIRTRKQTSPVKNERPSLPILWGLIHSLRMIRAREGLRGWSARRIGQTFGGLQDLAS